MFTQFISGFKSSQINLLSYILLWTGDRGLAHLNYVCDEETSERCQWNMLAGLRSMPDWVSSQETKLQSQSHHMSPACHWLTWRTRFSLSSHSETGLPVPPNGCPPWKGLDYLDLQCQQVENVITDIVLIARLIFSLGHKQTIGLEFVDNNHRKQAALPAAR